MSSAAERARRWRDQQRADAAADAALVRGLVLAAKGRIKEGRPRFKWCELDIQAICRTAASHLVSDHGLSRQEAAERVSARLTNAINPF